MVLPTFTPALGIFPAVGLLPVHKQRGITDRDRKFDFARKVGALIQSCVAAGNLETGTCLHIQGDFVATECETKAHPGIGVVAHIHSCLLYTSPSPRDS